MTCLKKLYNQKKEDKILLSISIILGVILFITGIVSKEFLNSAMIILYIGIITYLFFKDFKVRKGYKNKLKRQNDDKISLLKNICVTSEGIQSTLNKVIEIISDSNLSFGELNKIIEEYLSKYRNARCCL